ncbi:hypothetical protein BRADI_3g34102v3, partial [Brachypodium distachyon]
PGSVTWHPGRFSLPSLSPQLINPLSPSSPLPHDPLLSRISPLLSPTISLLQPPCTALSPLSTPPASHYSHTSLCSRAPWPPCPAPTRMSALPSPMDGPDPAAMGPSPPDPGVLGPVSTGSGRRWVCLHPIQAPLGFAARRRNLGKFFSFSRFCYFILSLSLSLSGGRPAPGRKWQRPPSTASASTLASPPVDLFLNKYSL